METKANYVAVGAFVLLGVLGLLIALLWLAGAQYQKEYAYYRAYFSGSVTGLGKGTPVRYDGIDVGQVSGLSFDPDNPKLVIVTMAISPSLPIHNDSAASIASEGLTGGAYVEIDGGSKNAPIVQPGSLSQPAVIRSKPSTLQELEESAPQLVAKLNHIADALNDVVNKQNRQALAELLDHLRNTSAVLDRDGPAIGHMLKNLDTASGSLNADLADMHQVLGDADTATKRIDRLADDIDTQVQNADLSRFVAESRILVQSLTALSNSLDQQPTRLLFGERRKGYSPP